LKIAICDDEERYLNQALSVADEYSLSRGDKNVSVNTYSHPEDLLEAVEKNGGYDIYILDIVMPGMNGIDLGIRLRDGGYNGIIIYLTSSEEYALDSFRVKAFHYILKPIKKEPFFAALDEAIGLISTKKDSCTVVKTKERTVKLVFDQILYAELCKRAVVFYLLGGKKIETLSVRTNFSDAISDLLKDKRFCLCGASMAVNLDHITEIENEAIVFGKNGKAFLGKKACRELRSTWTDYLFGEDYGI